MMVSILSRLLRLNSVRKPCQNLSFTPNSIKIHRHHYFSQTPTACSVLQPPILGRKMLGITHLPNPFMFLDSCKGLVCLGHPLSRDVVLWNPATNFWKTLPPSDTNLGASDMVSLGFGCNAEGDDYSVVRIFSLGKRLGVEVYSSKSDCWRTMDVGFKATVLTATNHVIANGNPYWLAEFVDSSKSEKEGVGLLGFNATKMAFEFVGVPRIGAGAKKTFITWRERLGALVTVKSDGDWLEAIDVWVYEDGERVWRRDARFGPIPMQVGRCLDCSSNGKIGGVCKDGEVFVYDSKEDSFVVTDVGKRVGPPLQMFPYDESLAYVQGMKALAEEEVEKVDSVWMEGFFVFSLPFFTEELSFYSRPVS